MHQVVVHYFSTLFSTSRPEIIVDHVSYINQTITGNMAEFLTRPYHRLEVEDALAEMHPYKSFGSDGMPALFYKKYWDLVG